jgi:hypothetical protein
LFAAPRKKVTFRAVAINQLFRMKYSIAVGIATAGRRSILSETLVELARHTRLPEALLVCPVAPDDFDASQVAQLPFPVQVVEGSRGLPAQRNAILDGAQDFDVVMFFDDDFFPEPSYLAELDVCLTANPLVVAATGRTLADDIGGPGLNAGEARAILASFVPSEDASPLVSQFSAYGCNMAMRLAPVARMVCDSTKTCRSTAGRKTWISAGRSPSMDASSRIRA